MKTQGAVARIRTLIIGFALMFSSLASFAQKETAIPVLSPLPQGINLPVRLTRALKAGVAKPGIKFKAFTTQRVPVTLHSYLPAATEIDGEVLASQPASSTSGPSVLTLRFTNIRYRGQSMPLQAKALAVANFVQVMDASVIASGATDRGNPDPANWTTNQVGGDQVYRSGWMGNVYSSHSKKVGFADFHGVYALPDSNTGLPRALGVFSSNSAGLYGFSDTASLASDGSRITVSDPSRPVILRKGDQLLLEVTSAAAGQQDLHHP